MTNGGVYPPRWTMIKNEWNIQTRNHVDQILIMDSINNIYLSSQVFHNNTWMLHNLKYGITPIYYCGYAAKIQPTMEPFKSLLAGIPIDVIQTQLNIFTTGINPANTNPVVTGSSPNGTVSPYSQNISIPAVTMNSNTTKNPIPTNGVLCDPQAGCTLGYLGTGVNVKLGCVAPSCTPAPLQYTVDGSRLTDNPDGSSNQGSNNVVIVPAYNGKVPAMIQVPLYILIKTLWDACSPANTTFVVVNNSEANIESSISDFTYITTNLKIIYRCYFWALNCSNKSIKGSNLQASAYTAFVTTPFNALGISTSDLSYLVDVAAYYKAIYDNTYQSQSDYSNMFSKPSYSSCQTGCSKYTDRSGTICVPTTSNITTCLPSPACTPMCNNNFCINPYPNYASSVLSTLNPVSPGVFCASNSAASSTLMNYTPSFYPQTKALPTPPPPPGPVQPRLGLNTPSIIIQDQETFLCEDRGLGNIYRYNKNSGSGPTKTKYSNVQIAMTYTPSMDVSNSSWVWSHSLDGTSLRCNQIPLDFSGSITCPAGKNCSPPSVAAPTVNSQPEEEEEEEEEQEEEAQEEEEPPPDNSANVTGGLVLCGIFGCILFVLIGGGVAAYFYLKSKQIPLSGKKNRKSSKGGDYFYYDW